MFATNKKHFYLLYPSIQKVFMAKKENRKNNKIIGFDCIVLLYILVFTVERIRVNKLCVKQNSLNV